MNMIIGNISFAPAGNVSPGECGVRRVTSKPPVKTERHYLQFQVGDRIREMQVPGVFVGCQMSGRAQIGTRWFIVFRLADESTAVVPMPEDYKPEDNWLIGGYRCEILPR